MTSAKILLVDDEPDAIAYVSEILEDEGREIISASDGLAGLERAKAEKPDLIILDVQMPKMDGFTVFAELKADETTKEIPVIMLTGVSEKTGIAFSKEDMGDFIGTEPSDYVEKPIEPEALLKAVGKVLGA